MWEICVQSVMPRRPYQATFDRSIYGWMGNENWNVKSAGTMRARENGKTFHFHSFHPFWLAIICARLVGRLSVWKSMVIWDYKALHDDVIEPEIDIRAFWGPNSTIHNRQLFELQVTRVSILYAKRMKYFDTAKLFFLAFLQSRHTSVQLIRKSGLHERINFCCCSEPNKRLLVKFAEHHSMSLSCTNS